MLDKNKATALLNTIMELELASEVNKILHSPGDIAAFSG